MRVLIVKTSSMGDVIHTLPAVTDAQNAMPNIQFDWLVEENFADIPALHQAVKTVIPVALRRWKKSVFKSQYWWELIELVKRLRLHHYDFVIDAQGLIKSAVLSVLCQGPRYGLDYQSSRESLASMTYHKTTRISRQLHAIERVRQLFEFSLGYSRSSETVDYGLSAYRWRSEKIIDTNAYLVFIHAASRPEKLWPVPNWAELAALSAQQGYQIKLLWGNDQEKQRAQAIAEKSSCCDVLPAMSLNDIASLFQHATAIIGVDTGLTHLAAALDVPVVSLYLSTSPDLVGTKGKYQTLVRFQQKHPDQDSEATMSVDHVWKKALRLIHTAKLDQEKDCIVYAQ
ncbi:MAG: lipopolysaccharide heptosyltransferase I [Gammaproteobacteria bacterium]|nr:lipopolysaccharide heptosyltransferase I [Gammaproteobacteria bacterium]